MSARETGRTAQASLDLSKLVETEGERLAAEVGEVFSEVAAAKERVPLIGSVLAWFARSTEAAAKTAADDQRALEAERADDAPLIAAREKQKRALSARLVGVRKVVDSVCDDNAVGLLGYVGDTPENETELVTLAGKVLKGMKEHPPKAVRGGVTLDLAKLTAGIKEDAAALDATLKALVKESREASAALVKRDKSLRVARMRQVGLGRVLQGVYEFVGDSESAARVHKALGRIADGAAEEPAATDETPKKE